MGDSAAERGPCRGVSVDMDELMVVGGVGEGGNAVLRDVEPVRKADFLANFRADFGERCKRHQRFASLGVA